MKIFILRLKSAIIIGILLGASGMNLYISTQYEALVVKNKALEEELISTQNSLEELKGRLEQQQRRNIITDIKPQLVIEEEDMSSYELTSAKLDGEKKMSELLDPFKGQDVKEINFNLLPRIIDGREFDSEGRKFILKVDVVVVTEELAVFATANLIKRSET